MNNNQKTLLFVAGAVVVAGVAVSSRGGSMSKPILPKPVTQNGIKICIDPGHGDGATNVGATNPNTKVLERDEVLRAGFILEKLLLAQGFKVIMTRRTVDAPGTPKNDLAARVAIANSFDADLLLSLHMDCWAINGNPCAGAGILFNSLAGQSMATGLAKALDVVTPGSVYTKNGDWLYIAKYQGRMLLVEIDRVQRLTETDLTNRMKAIAAFLSNWYTSE
jgi:N-acetylmuramoyl-L-alanine amidase